MFNEKTVQPSKFPGFGSFKEHKKSFEHFQDFFLNKIKETPLSTPKESIGNKIRNSVSEEEIFPQFLTVIPLECREKDQLPIQEEIKEKDIIIEENKFINNEFKGMKNGLENMKIRSDSFSFPEGEVQKHLTSLSPYGDFSEVIDFRNVERKDYNNTLLEIHLKKEDSTVLPFVKRFVNKLKNACSVRNIHQMKPITFKILADSSYYFDELEKNQDFNELNGVKNCFLMITKFYESKIYQIKKSSLINIWNNFILGNKMVIHPYHYMKILWDLIHLILIISWFFYIPLVITFEGVSDLDPLISFSTGLFLIIDIFLNFNTAYFINGMAERNRRRIVSHYLQATFFLDALTLFTTILDQILLQNYGITYGEFFPLHLFKFLFFLKIKTMYEIIHRINERFLLTEKFQNLISLFKVFFISILVAHLFACFWYFAAQHSNSATTWLSRANLLDSSWNVKYLYAMYWAIITMMTVGYGDITPQNEVEIIVCMITVVLGCGVYAYNISSIGILLQNFNKENAEFNHKINIINQYMNRKNINRDLQMRIREYLRFIWKEENTQNLEDEQKIIEHLSNSLREELLIEAYGDILQKYPMFFANFTEKSLRKVVSIIKDIKLFPEEKIFLENEEDDFSIYFIIKGKVELSTESGISIKELGVGEHFGEIAFFSGKARKLSARSKDFTTLFAINRDEFIKVLMKNSDDMEKFCMIKDQMISYENYFPLKIHCYSCLQIGHLAHQCPLIHFIPDREKVIKKYNYYLDQERAEFYRRTFKRNSLTQKNKLVWANKKIKIFIEMEKAALIKALDEDYLSMNTSEHSSFDNFENDENNILEARLGNKFPSVISTHSAHSENTMTIAEGIYNEENVNKEKKENDSLNYSAEGEVFDSSTGKINSLSLPVKNENDDNSRFGFFKSADNLEEKSFVLKEEIKSDATISKNLSSISPQKISSNLIKVPERKKSSRQKFNTEILKRDQQMSKKSNTYFAGDLEHNLLLSNSPKTTKIQKANSNPYSNEMKRDLSESNEGKVTFMNNSPRKANQKNSLGSQNQNPSLINLHSKNNFIPKASLLIYDMTLDNFDRVASFKSYFPENNSKFLFEVMNKNLSKIRSQSMSQMRKKSFETKLSKYTFFPETMRQKMPDEIRKKVRKASIKKKRKTHEKNLEQESNEKSLDKSLSKFMKKKKTMLLSGRFFEEKFSNLVQFIMNNPTLKKSLKKSKITKQNN